MSGSKRNAFQQLMQSSSKKTKKSQFVSCPICGANVLQFTINSHLDSCCIDSDRKHPILTGNVAGSNKPTPSISNSKTKTKTDEKPNAFAHMMKQSQEMHRVARFHLNIDYSLTWVDDDVTPSEGVAWTSTVRLRGGRVSSTSTQLIVSTAIPEHEKNSAPVRLVQRHSRLSIPVLKSVIQKSVRRRRPLPATRVAMELADRAMGELLRRLPIIIFEDSTLHTGLPLLCWLMAAESKGYRLPPELVVRVLQIVYEIASCPWKDSLSDSDVAASEDTASATKTTDTTTLAPQCVRILKSIQMRASYGGMSCDMRMLDKFLHAWDRRFRGGKAYESVSKRLSSSSKPLDWADLPSHVHVKGQQQSLQHVLALTKQGLVKLELKDICVEGVDFHCSDVIARLLDDGQFVQAGMDRLQSEGLIFQNSTKDELGTLLKQCMWDFSSGINHRQSLTLSPVMKSKDDDKERLKAFWNDSVSSRAKDFMTKYVTSRLAS